MIIKRLIKTIILLFWIISSATAQEVNYLRFTALENNVEIGIQNDSKLKFTFEYSINGDGIWAEFDTTKTITLPKQGDFISFRGENNKLATRGNKYANFVFSKNVAASGSVMSLISYKDGLPTTIPANYFFCKLFLNCSTLVSAPDLTAETLTQNCYNSMFQGCTSLEQAPNISATSYEKGCMNNMFVGCIS
ncbi:MAG: hypothetical protein J5826_01780, partial [Bacteroidales bacterium]|nr:hypothetical protein [Bacteroidales bacterium]